MGLKINNDAVVIASGGAQSTATTYTWEIEGSDTAEYRLTELDQVDPKGRWRFRLHDNELVIEAASEKNWSKALAYLVFNGATKKVQFKRHHEDFRGDDIDNMIETLSDRIEKLTGHLRYIIFALSDLGIELPQDTVDLLNQLTSNPDEMVEVSTVTL